MKRHIALVAAGLMAISSGTLAAVVPAASATASCLSAGQVAATVPGESRAGQSALADSTSTRARSTDPTLPTIDLWSPIDGWQYDNPASITMKARVTVPSGKVDRVEFFVNRCLLGSVTTAPYQMRIRVAADGTYILLAKVYDDAGRSASSQEITVTVSTPPTVTVRGPVAAGVEAGCLILRGEDGATYELLNGDPAIVKPGALLEVTGVLRRDVATYCMQGRALQVISATPITA